MGPPSILGSAGPLVYCPIRMYSYNPDRKGLSEVKLLGLEPWRVYPGAKEHHLGFLQSAPQPSHPRIDRDTPIASIGSCFAREIKLWLLRQGYNYLQMAEGPCTEAGSARYDRAYNTFTIRQEFERAFGSFEPIVDCWTFDDGQVRLLDPYRRNVAWESHEEMRTELEEHRENVRRAFREARVVVITVGQSEIWFDKRDGSVFPLVPPVEVYDKSIHGFRISTFEENVANLERVHDLLIEENPEVSIIITVSPVPLRATFQRRDAISANCASKSMLRAAVERFASTHDQAVTYFPAYEICTSFHENAYEDDCRHVRAEMIDKIMRTFEEWFVRGLPASCDSNSTIARD